MKPVKVSFVLYKNKKHLLEFPASVGIL